jgi:hypothetical protein
VLGPPAIPQLAPETVPELERYVADCAEALWQPRGAPVRRWLTETRRLPEDVLRLNRVGVDFGPRHQDRPDGVPSVRRAVVLPVLTGGDLRVLDAGLGRFADNHQPARQHQGVSPTTLRPDEEAVGVLHVVGIQAGIRSSLELVPAVRRSPACGELGAELSGGSYRGPEPSSGPERCSRAATEIRGKWIFVAGGPGLTRSHRAFPPQ